MARILGEVSHPSRPLSTTRPLVHPVPPTDAFGGWPTSASQGTAALTLLLETKFSRNPHPSGSPRTSLAYGTTAAAIMPSCRTVSCSEARPTVIHPSSCSDTWKSARQSRFTAQTVLYRGSVQKLDLTLSTCRKAYFATEFYDVSSLVPLG